MTLLRYLIATCAALMMLLSWGCNPAKSLFSKSRDLASTTTNNNSLDNKSTGVINRDGASDFSVDSKVSSITSKYGRASNGGYDGPHSKKKILPIKFVILKSGIQRITNDPQGLAQQEIDFLNTYLQQEGHQYLKAQVVKIIEADDPLYFNGGDTNMLVLQNKYGEQGFLTMVYAKTLPGNLLGQANNLFVKLSQRPLFLIGYEKNIEYKAKETMPHEVGHLLGFHHTAPEAAKTDAVYEYFFGSNNLSCSQLLGTKIYYYTHVNNTQQTALNYHYKDAQGQSWGYYNHLMFSITRNGENINRQLWTPGYQVSSSQILECYYQLALDF